MKRIMIAVLGVAAVSVASGCAPAGSSSRDSNADTTSACASATTRDASLPTDPGKITIGSANFPESQLLAYVYGAAFETKGVKVTYHQNIGARAVYIAALEQGEIGMVPEYTGAALDYFDHHSGDSVTAPADVYASLKRTAGCRGLTVTAYARAQDTDTITVTKTTAEKYHLRSVGDLSPVAGSLSLGAPPALQTSSYGTPALAKTYGVRFGRFVSLSPSGTITQTALQKGTVDAADIFSTDPSIEKYGFVSLRDDKHIFAAENVVPLFRDDALTEPMAEIADAVGTKLTTETLAALNAQIAGGASAADVARTWVKTLDIH